MAAAVEKAYIAIRQGIVCGAYGPGEHLTANDLATANGLSRTPVREAMRRLHTEGLIRFVPHRGAFVTHFDDSDIDKIYDLRVLLEGHAAEAAARNATPAQLETLHEIASDIAELVEDESEDSLQRIPELNNSFHKLIVKAADNTKLEAVLASIVEIPLVLRTFQRYQADELRRSARQHIELVEGLKAKDPCWSKSVMTSHILAARHVLMSKVAGANRER